MRWRVPGWASGVSRHVHIQKALRGLTTAEGEQFRLSPKTGRLVPATCGSSGPGGFSQHDARLLTGGAVDIVVAEEYLRGGSAEGTVLGHVVGTDVDGGCGGFLNELDAGGLAVGAGDTVGLAFGGFDDQEDSAVVGKSLVQLEGEGVTLAHDGGGGRVLHAQEGGRYENRLSAASDDPVVQAGEQVGAGDLGTGAENTAALLGEGQLVPGKDVVVREGLPHGGEPLEDALDLSLVGSADGAAISAVADVLPVLHLSGSHALGGSAHLLEGDGRNVLHNRLSFRKLLNNWNRRYSIEMTIRTMVQEPSFRRNFCQKVSSFSM